MSPAADSLAATAVLREHLGRVLAPSTTPVCPAIDPTDEMLTYPIQVLGRSATDAVLEYFQVGNATFSLLSQVLDWLGTDWARVGSVLDFASGYGRVARFLAAAGARLTVADIVAPAVEFQRRELGVAGFLSTTQPERAPIGGPHDFISVISLFSHLPATTFTQWLQRLGAALAPGGVLLFTTHGEAAFAREGGKRLPPNGFSFHRASESKRLDTAEYGTSFVHPQYVERLVAAQKGLSLLAVVPHGLNDHQDVYVVGRDRARPATTLQLVPVPKVCIDVAERRTDGSVHAAGWALDGTGREPAPSVRLFAGAAALGAAALGQPRPDLVPVFQSARAAAGGWQIAADAGAVGDGWVTAVAEDGRGRRGFACRHLPE